MLIIQIFSFSKVRKSYDKKNKSDYSAFYTSCNLKLPKRKWIYFPLSEKEKRGIALVTASFYFEAERKIGLFNWINLGYKWDYISFRVELIKSAKT